MKFILLFACFALLVVYNEAQRCRGRVPRAERNCLGGRDSGTRRGDNCHRNSNDEMWYFSRRTRSCRRMSYRGCGGNKNRYCSLESCERKCVRPGPVDPITPQPNNPTTAAPADPTPAPAAD